MVDYAILMAVSLGDNHNRTRQEDISFCFCCCFLSSCQIMCATVMITHTARRETTTLQRPGTGFNPVSPFRHHLSPFLFLLIVSHRHHHPSSSSVVIISCEKEKEKEKELSLSDSSDFKSLCLSLMTSNNSTHLSGTTFSPVVVKCPSHRFMDE